MTSILVRRADLGDEAIVRSLRLQALADAPHAFDALLEQERAWTLEAWRRWIFQGATFLLLRAQEPRGLAAGVPHRSVPGAAFLVSVWLHPVARGSGAGGALVAAVLAWAETERMREVWLHVGKENLPARRLYERAGFRPTGQEIVRPLDGLVEIEMRRPLGPSAGGSPAVDASWKNAVWGQFGPAIDPLENAIRSCPDALGADRARRPEFWSRAGAGIMAPRARGRDRSRRIPRLEPERGVLPMAEIATTVRTVKRIVKAKPTIEGAGVHLRRAFGFGTTTDFDPFLLLDDFRNDRPQDYLAGFPWHPHRGIETITYVLAGTVEHGDSMGNKGTIGAGDVQWMTAGSGVIHQEMPKGDGQGHMHGFQLWANLPSSLKMTRPRYQDVKAADIPVVTDDDGTQVRVVCGSFWGKTGPVDEIAARPIYLDVSIPAGKRKSLPVETTRNAFAYVFAGSAKICNASGPLAVPTESPGWLDTHPPTEADNRSLVLFDRGDEVTVEAGEEGVRFLLLSGEPLREPVAWYGPIVMNTQEELRRAFEELERGTFLQSGARR
jgi:hypothetical protein